MHELAEVAAMDEFLRATEIIDWNHPSVHSQAKSLSHGTTDALEIAKRSFEWVRDNIQHSIDFQRNPVTCSASEVLKAGTGFCYAKSHLLAALLRANGIPVGFCYQRFIGERRQNYIVHGLNAINLPGFGWYRVDARGNKTEVNAQFTPPVEQLAFHAVSPGERLFPQILPDPLNVVVAALKKYSDWLELWDNLPDWPYSSLPAPGIELQTPAP
jgi:transglutaminase-like putative cysteine protease